MHILVVGSVALDDVKTPFGARKKILGGSASHFSVAASLLSMVRIVAVVGKDFPSRFSKYLTEKGIDTRGIEITKEKTFHWSGRYEFDMNTAYSEFTHLGGFAHFDPILTEDERDMPIVFLANIDPVIQLKVLKQMKNPRFIGLDSMNYWIESKKKELLQVIKKADAIFLNDAEIRQLAQEASLIKAARKIQKMGPRLVLVKKGEHGVLCVSNNFTFMAAAYPTESVKDPTGAGDTFAGGFVSYLASKIINNPNLVPNEEIIRQAVIWGSAVASFSVENFSTTGLDNITIAKVRQRCHAIFEQTKFNPHE